MKTILAIALFLFSTAVEAHTFRIVKFYNHTPTVLTLTYENCTANSTVTPYGGDVDVVCPQAPSGTTTIDVAPINPDAATNWSYTVTYPGNVVNEEHCRIIVHSDEQDFTYLDCRKFFTSRFP